MATRVPEIGRETKMVRSPPEINRDCRSDRSTMGPRTKASGSGAGSKSQFPHPVAEGGEEEHRIDVEDLVLDAVDADRREQDDDRGEDAVGDAEHLHPEPNHREIQDEEHRVSDVHRGDDPPEDVRVFRDQERPRRDPLDHQGREDHGDRGVSRDPQGEERDEG